MNSRHVFAIAAVAGICIHVDAAAAKSVELTAAWCPGLEILLSTEVAPQQIIAAIKGS
jgi:hypothetical protein